jgi:hypothetical protein
MALSFEAMRKQNVSKPILWKKVRFFPSVCLSLFPSLSVSVSLLPVSFSVWTILTSSPKAFQRSATLFAIGMFLANGYELSTWRIPGQSPSLALARPLTASLQAFFNTSVSHILSPALLSSFATLQLRSLHLTMTGHWI